MGYAMNGLLDQCLRCIVLRQHEELILLTKHLREVASLGDVEAWQQSKWLSGVGYLENGVSRLVLDAWMSAFRSRESALAPMLLHVLLLQAMEPCPNTKQKHSFHLQNGDDVNTMCFKKCRLLRDYVIELLQNQEYVSRNKEVIVGVFDSIWRGSWGPVDDPCPCGVIIQDFLLSLLPSVPCEIATTLIHVLVPALLNLEMSTNQNEACSVVDTIVYRFLDALQKVQFHCSVQHSSAIQDALADAVVSHRYVREKRMHTRHHVSLLLVAFSGQWSTRICATLMNNTEIYPPKQIAQKSYSEGTCAFQSLMTVDPQLCYMLGYFSHICHEGSSTTQLFDFVKKLLHLLQVEKHAAMPRPDSSDRLLFVCLYICVHRHESLTGVWKEYQEFIQQVISRSQEKISPGIPMVLQAVFRHIVEKVEWSVARSQFIPLYATTLHCDWESFPFATFSLFSKCLENIGHWHIPSRLSSYEGILSRAFMFHTKKRKSSLDTLHSGETQNRKTQNSVMQGFSKDILILIFGFSTYKRVCRLSTLCRTFHEAGTSAQLWETFYHQRWQPSVGFSSCLHGPQYIHDWQRMYREHLMASRKCRPKGSGYICSECSCYKVNRSLQSLERHKQSHAKHRCKHPSCHASYGSAIQLRNHYFYQHRNQHLQNTALDT